MCRCLRKRLTYRHAPSTLNISSSYGQIASIPKCGILRCFVALCHQVSLASSEPGCLSFYLEYPNMLNRSINAPISADATFIPLSDSHSRYQFQLLVTEYSNRVAALVCPIIEYSKFMCYLKPLFVFRYRIKSIFRSISCSFPSLPLVASSLRGCHCYLGYINGVRVICFQVRRCIAFKEVSRGLAIYCSTRF